MNNRIAVLLASVSLSIPLMGAASPGSAQPPKAYAATLHILSAPASRATLPSTPFYRQELSSVKSLQTPGHSNVTLIIDSPAHLAALKAYARAVSTPGSPEYHRFLTARSLAKEFGPGPALTKEARQALAEAGWKITGQTTLTLSAQVDTGPHVKIPVSPAIYAVSGINGGGTVVPQAQASTPPLRRLTQSTVSVRPDVTDSTAALAPYSFASAPVLSSKFTSSNGEIFSVLSFNPAITASLPAGLPFNLVLTAQNSAGTPLAVASVSNVQDSLNNVASYGTGQVFPGSHNTLWQLELVGLGASTQNDTLSATVTLANGTTQNVSFSLPPFTGSATALFPLTGKQISDLLGAGALYERALSATPPPVAILTVGPAPSLTDLSTLMSQEGLPTPPVTFHDEGPKASATQADSPNQLESALDLQAVASSAPGAPIEDYLYSPSDTADPLTSFLSLLAQADGPKIATVSYGFYGENTSTLTTLINACTAEGITLVFASGDEGAYASASGTSLGLPDTDSQPGVLTVGGINLAATATFANNGTMTSLQGPAILKAWGGDYLDGLPLPTLEAYLAENNASTGGYGSAPVPSWQTASLPSSATGIGVPDISSLAGIPDFQGVYGGSPAVFGGTSLAAPLTAGWLADLESVNGIGTAGLGNITPLLFQTAQQHPDDFLQALWGSNGVYQVTSSQSGTWNPVTGLGVPLWDSLAEAWVSKPVSQLQLVPSQTEVVQGQPCTFTLTAEDADGLPVSSFSGTITLSSSDPKAFLPSSVTFEGGQATFSVTFQTPGPQTLTATDAEDPSFDTTSPAVTVTSPVVLSASPGAVVGKAVTLSATVAPGIDGARYQFWLKNPASGQWSALGPYTGTRRIAFTPNVPGAYQAKVFVKVPGAATVTATDMVSVHAPQGVPMVSQVQLTGPVNPFSANQSATFTAQATDAGGTPLYQFWVHGPDNVWKMVQNYSTQDTLTLPDLRAGSYAVAVYALGRTQYQRREFPLAFYQTTVLNVGSAVSLTVPESAVAGQGISVQAAATGITQPVYQFWIENPSGRWTQSGPYGSSTFQFTPSAAGTYTVTVFAKDPIAPATSAFAVVSTQPLHVS